MKPRIVIFISLLALLVLILIQYYSISEVYRLKRNEFDMSYDKLLQEALDNLEYQNAGNGLDSVFYYLDFTAYQNLETVASLDREENKAEILKDLLGEFQGIIYTKETLSPQIESYLRTKEVDSDFNSGFVIRKLEILDFPAEYVIYNEELNDAGEILVWDPDAFENSLHVNSYNVEGNYFRMAFDYYVDFRHKTAIIFNEMLGTLTLAVFTVIIVVLVFLYTFRNMMKQKKMSDMKTDFINNMTHELKTPLTTIAVASSTLADPSIHTDESKVIDISRMITKQNRHLNHLIDHILDINLWETDQVSLEKKKFFVLPFLRERINGFRMEHRNDDMVITEDYDLKDLEVNADEFHFTTVLNNLLANAVKYSLSGPEITIRAFVEDSLVISIEDNGIGIAREDQKNIFTKFYRGNPGMVQEVKGLGLGLYYVKRIVEAHGGQIRVKSKPGKGSTFSVILPLTT